MHRKFCNQQVRGSSPRGIAIDTSGVSRTPPHSLMDRQAQGKAFCRQNLCVHSSAARVCGKWGERMGHVRPGAVPGSKTWRDGVDMLETDAPPDEVARAAARASGRDPAGAGDDPRVRFVAALPVRVPLYAAPSRPSSTSCRLCSRQPTALQRATPASEPRRMLTALRTTESHGPAGSGGGLG